MSISHQGGNRVTGLGRWDSLYISLVPLPTVLLIAVLISDSLYWATGSPSFSRASEWLLGAGLTTGVIAAADGLIRYVSVGCIRLSRTCWMHVVGDMLALVLSLSNLIYRLNEDGAGAVVPTGISLTAIVLCLLFATAGLGGGIGIDTHDGEADETEPL
jgi:uncharacterized membrane protein